MQFVAAKKKHKLKAIVGKPKLKLPTFRAEVLAKPLGKRRPRPSKRSPYPKGTGTSKRTASK
jgi:hypothetical protein